MWRKLWCRNISMRAIRKFLHIFYYYTIFPFLDYCVLDYIIIYSDIRSYFEIGLLASICWMSYIYDGFFPEFNYIHPFQILIFSPLLLPTDYKLHIQGIFFSRKKGDHTRQTEKTQGKEKEEKNCPKNIVRPGAIKFGAIVPTSRRVSPFMPLVNQASPILAPIKGFFFFFGPKDHRVKRSCSFFSWKKKSNHSLTQCSPIYT